MDETLDKLQDVLRKVFGDDELELSRESTAEDVDGWDSMMHINVMIAVEKKFGVKFAAAEMNSLKGEGKTIGDFVDLIDRKVGTPR